MTALDNLVRSKDSESTVPNLQLMARFLQLEHGKGFRIKASHLVLCFLHLIQDLRILSTIDSSSSSDF